MVSKKLKLKIFDTDECIEKEMNMKIPDIFNEKGEKFFRDIEKKNTLKNFKEENIVVALGGGAFLNDIVRKEIVTSHLSFG